jgi:hypothetical protein
MSDLVFVFGSNLAGRHGRGAALFALHRRGAVYGRGEGHYGQSYAIPTKDAELVTLPLETIELYVKRFLEYAAVRADLEFEVTPIGCGLAGYTPADIHPMFKHAPPNCHLPRGWGC